MNRHYAGVAELALHRCEYCHAPESVFNFPFEVEHIVPIIHGGQDHNGNRALACRACNLHKAAFLAGVDLLTNTAVPLFNPRQEHWDDHFRIERTTGEIIGRTPTGRATVTRLKMNSDAQLAARQQWMRLELFP